MSYPRPSVTNETYDPNGMFAGDHPIRGEVVTIDAGALVAGSVLGKITATGKYILSLEAASDGSEVPVAVLAEPADATAGDVTALAYFAGDFIAEKLTVGTGWTVATVEQAWLQAGRPLYVSNRTPK